MTEIGKEIWVTDPQRYWRSMATKALETAYKVRVFEKYRDLEKAVGSPAHPDLVLLGCVRFRNREKNLVDTLLKKHIPVVVQVQSMPVEEMSDLFRKGVRNVFPRPETQYSLIKRVNKTFRDMDSRFLPLGAAW